MAILIRKTNRSKEAEEENNNDKKKKTRDFTYRLNVYRIVFVSENRRYLLTPPFLSS